MPHLLVHDGHSSSLGAAQLLAKEVECNRHQLPDDDGVTFLKDLISGSTSAASISRESVPDVTLAFLVHCAPDGSCSKCVRKLTRGLKMETEEPCTLNMIKSHLRGVHVKLLLLSGATCANSATMAGPSIFAGGQRLRTALQRSGAPTLAEKGNVRLLHAELCDLQAAMQEVSGAWFPADLPSSAEGTPKETASASVEPPTDSSPLSVDESAAGKEKTTSNQNGKSSTVSSWRRLPSFSMCPFTLFVNFAIGGVAIAAVVGLFQARARRVR